MNVQEIIKSGANVNVTINIEELRFILNEAIENTKRELQDIVLADKAETYPTVKQVSEILQVDVTTLWRWNKKGYLKTVEFGGGRRYKMSEIKALLNGGIK